MIGPLHDLDHPEFHTGLAVGIAATALGAAIALATRTRRRAVLPIGGVLVGAGFAAGVRRAPHLPGSIVAGLILLALAGAAAGELERRTRSSGLLGAMLAVPGAVFLATHLRVPPVHARNYTTWMPLLVVTAVAVGAPLVADFDRRLGDRGWSMPLFAVSALGVFFTVPDTERAMVLVGVAIPLLVLGWPLAVASLGSAGAYVAVGVLVWVSATEGRGRHSAIIGGIACLGLLVVEPSARWLRRGLPTALEQLPRSRWMLFPGAALHLLLVYVASRVAGIRHELLPTVVIVVVELTVAVVALTVARRRTGLPPGGAIAQRRRRDSST